MLHLNHTRSLSFRIVLLFLLVLMPLLVFLFYNNLYAMNVVREQVAQFNAAFLESHVSEIDRNLSEIHLYLTRFAHQDPEFTTLTLKLGNPLEYETAKQRLLMRLNNDLSIYNMIDSIFIYFTDNDDLIVATKETYTNHYSRLKQLSPALVNGKDEFSLKWQPILAGQDYYLVKIVDSGSNIYIGALISLETLRPLIDFSGKGNLAILSDQGLPMLNPAISSATTELVRQRVSSSKLYQIVKDPRDNKKYLMLGKASSRANLQYVMLLPEKDMLQDLPFFQKAIDLIPMAGIILIVFGFVSLQKVLFMPLSDLMRGMRRVARGDLSVRLRKSNLAEFSFLEDTFNNMVSQIKDLKIDVYEEKLKVQRAEFNHLQVQIHPHFYLNSLNIIHNLSAIKRNDLVRKMVEHLADYFRFITRTSSPIIPLHDEIRHVSNYLEIQRIMFPNRFTYGLEISPECQEFPIVPFTVQPLVENAIVHGLMRDKDPLRVDITACFTGEGGRQLLVIRICDNGHGFPPEQLEELTTGTYFETVKDKHLGIWSVHRRLRIHYGPSASLSFANRERGAIVTVRLPVDASQQEGSTNVQSTGG